MNLVSILDIATPFELTISAGSTVADAYLDYTVATGPAHFVIVTTPCHYSPQTKPFHYVGEES